GGARGGQASAASGIPVLISMGGYWRSGQLIDHKEKVDQALEAAKQDGQHVDKVLVWRRYAGQYHSKTPMVAGRDFYVDEVLKDYANKTVEPVQMDATAPLFLMYTSGTTAKPKGVQHGTAGYLAY